MQLFSACVWTGFTCQAKRGNKSKAHIDDNKENGVADNDTHQEGGRAKKNRENDKMQLPCFPMHLIPRS